MDAIEQHSAPKILVQEVMLGAEVGYEGASPDDHLHTPDRSRPEKVANRRNGRQKSGPHGFHDEVAPVPGFIDDCACFPRIDGEGLFAEHRFRATQASEHVVVMDGVRRRDIDGVHPGVRREFGIASPALADAVSPGKVLR
jgi:hypothetical protein